MVTAGLCRCSRKTNRGRGHNARRLVQRGILNKSHGSSASRGWFKKRTSHAERGPLVNIVTVVQETEVPVKKRGAFRILHCPQLVRFRAKCYKLCTTQPEWPGIRFVNYVVCTVAHTNFDPNLRGCWCCRGGSGCSGTHLTIREPSEQIDAGPGVSSGAGSISGRLLPPA